MIKAGLKSQERRLGGLKEVRKEGGEGFLLEVTRRIWGSDVRLDHQPVGVEKEKEQLFISAECGGGDAETHYSLTCTWPFTPYR